MNQALSEYLTAQFYAWEKRGRGWHTFEQPVRLEPKFIPFFGHFLPTTTTQIDDGKRPRFFPALQEALGWFKKPNATAYGEKVFERLEELYEVRASIYDNQHPVTELTINFEKDTKVSFEHIEQLLLMLSTSEEITGFEIFGTGERIAIQFVCTGRNANTFKSYIGAYAPSVGITLGNENLLQSIDIEQGIYGTDLGLRDEFMRPLRVWTKFDPDPLAGCIAALESVGDGEFGMLQILFQAAVNPWAESVQRAISDGKGGSFFADAPEMVPLTKEKISSPLYAAVVRTFGQGKTEERARAISQNIAQSLISFHRTGSNTLIPLEGISCDADDIISRRSKRIGMLLNSNELASMVHIPARSVLSAKFKAYAGKTKKAPSLLEGHQFELGMNMHLGQETMVTLSDQHRLRHMHVVGATGTGKSSLLLKLITQDIAQGRGIAVLDPHGDLIEGVIRHMTPERLRDVVLVDPSDGDYPIGLNLLSASTDPEKIILSSDLVALFRRFSTSWGDQMTSVLSNAVNAILESREGGTLIDLRRFLVEAPFRNKFLQTVEDPTILYYWKNEFQLLRPNIVSPILTRLDTFLRPRIVRNMMAQKEGLDFREILDTQKILLVKLAQGLIGEENSYLLGTLFVTKLQQAAQSRQNIAAEERKPFYFYIDEFQNFVTPSMSAILSGARKYGLGLILAHQDLDQLAYRDAELANSVLSNPSIRICFRCGDKDAAKLESGFAYFDATDLQNLATGHAIARVGQKDHDFNLSFPLVPKVEASAALEKQQTVVNHCRHTYALHQSKVADIVKDAFQGDAMPSKPASPLKESKAKEPSDISIETEKRQEVQATSKADRTREAQQFTDKAVEKEKQREHRFIQEFVKKIAEARNFKAVLEEPVNDYAGKVDVSLHRDDLKIACEISVTNTVEYEVQNIHKCLTADYSLVFMISNDPKHLSAIRTLAVSAVDQAFHNRLYFVSKDEFVSQLDLLLAQQSQPEEVRVKGYRVKVEYTGSADAAGQQKALKDVILSSMRRRGS